MTSGTATGDMAALRAGSQRHLIGETRAIAYHSRSPVEQSGTSEITGEPFSPLALYFLCAK
jgi:hypothetical protein